MSIFHQPLHAPVSGNPTRMLLVSVLAVSMALAGSAFAGQKAALPKDLPAYGPDKPLPVPAIAQKTLANGMAVWVVPRDGLPRVDYVLAVRGAGFAADASDAPGFAQMLAYMLNEGTARRDSRAIAEAAQGYGGSVGASTGNDGILVNANALRSHAGDMLALLAEVARQPSFPEEEVQLAQANELQSLKAAEAQPGFRATRALLAATYGDHPYARTQYTEASINAVTVDALRAEHQRRFRPERALLVITGKVGADEGFRMAEAAFGDWRGQGEPVPETPAVDLQVAPKYVLLERPGSVQSAVRLGRPAIAATDPDYIPLTLAAEVLGGGFSSRVNQNLREEKGYTYGAFADLAAERAGGRIHAEADVRNEVTGAAIREFESEFSRIGNELVPEQELIDTKRYVAGGYLISNQLQGPVARTLANNWLDGLPPEFLGQYVSRIRAVDAAAVQAVARQYFAPKDQSIIVVGDGKAVADQLKPFGDFEVRE